ncbi:zinc finger CCCH domain-containing protein 20-like [Olea europaea var. sylvestris]|uniref:zinc finger CCCH domain-containing protein 20-like n=1 Tax=Olea europaea var. sylvestris TaxID=158386 RepID=UPI000C1D5E6F|nr:zinc finger CCCH domain-containing protein 20-like [Olea europaea var. sylvestris]
MMMGEMNRPSPTVHVPPWSFTPENHTFSLSPKANANGGVDDYSVFFQNDSISALKAYLQSCSPDIENGNGDFPVDAQSCDHFRMFEFKVRKCTRGRSHDWTECPYAHPGEKARRRDPRKFHYSGTACPEFRKGSCRKSDGCEFAHGVFECWLHPARYRTQPCKDGMNCKRRVCFFAHSPDQLRVLSPQAESYDVNSPHRLAFRSSSDSGSPATESPPISPMTNSASKLSRSLGSGSINEMAASLSKLQLNHMNSMPSPLNRQVGLSFPMSRPGYFSLPTTPTQAVSRPGMGYFDAWDENYVSEEPMMERVESGRDLRAKMFEKLSKENPLDRDAPNPNPNPKPSDSPNPDVEWISELVN